MILMHPPHATLRLPRSHPPYILHQVRNQFFIKTTMTVPVDNGIPVFLYMG